MSHRQEVQEASRIAPTFRKQRTMKAGPQLAMSFPREDRLCCSQLSSLAYIPLFRVEPHGHSPPLHIPLVVIFAQHMTGHSR